MRARFWLHYIQLIPTAPLLTLIFFLQDQRSQNSVTEVVEAGSNERNSNLHISSGAFQGGDMAVGVPLVPQLDEDIESDVLATSITQLDLQHQLAQEVCP